MCTHGQGKGNVAEADVNNSGRKCYAIDKYINIDRSQQMTLSTQVIYVCD